MFGAGRLRLVSFLLLSSYFINIFLQIINLFFLINGIIFWVIEFILVMLNPWYCIFPIFNLSWKNPVFVCPFTCSPKA